MPSAETVPQSSSVPKIVRGPWPNLERPRASRSLPGPLLPRRLLWRVGVLVLLAAIAALGISNLLPRELIAQRLDPHGLPPIPWAT